MTNIVATVPGADGTYILNEDEPPQITRCGQYRIGIATESWDVEKCKWWWFKYLNNATLRQKIMAYEPHRIKILEQSDVIDKEGTPTPNEYTLVSMNVTDDTGGIGKWLLMTCPSTRQRHSIRVPPDTSSVDSALLYINRGLIQFDIET